MDELGAISATLRARRTAATRGELMTFQVGDAWLTLTATTSPHLELTMPAPALAGLTLRLQLGAPTLVGDLGPIAPVRDPRWEIRTSDPVRTAELLAEPPWPQPGELHEGAGVARQVGRSLLAYVTYGLIASDVELGTTPTPRFILEVEGGEATILRRTEDVAPPLAAGVARRLVQLVTRPARIAAAATPRPPLAPRGPYR